MASLSTCHLGLWLGWQILLNLVKYKKALTWALKVRGKKEGQNQEKDCGSREKLTGKEFLEDGREAARDRTKWRKLLSALCTNWGAKSK